MASDRKLEVSETLLQLQAYSNPAVTQFSIKAHSSNKREDITVIVCAQLGRVVGVKRGLNAEQFIQVAANYTLDIYYMEAVQGNDHQKIQVAKTN